MALAVCVGLVVGVVVGCGGGVGGVACAAVVTVGVDD